MYFNVTQGGGASYLVFISMTSNESKCLNLYANPVNFVFIWVPVTWIRW